LKYVWPIIVWVIFSLWSIWPTYSRLGIPRAGWDGVLITYLIAAPSLFDGGIFYPHNDTLLYSDLHRVTAWMMAPVATVTSNLNWIYPLALLMGQLLTGVVIYLWTWELSGRKWLAALVTSALLVSAIRIEYQIHLQMWSMQYWLISSYLWWRYLKTNRLSRLCLSGIFLGIQWWESPLPIYFAAVVNAIIFFVNGKKSVKSLLFVLLIGFTIGSPVIYKYWQVGHEFAYQRSIREAAHGGMSIDELWGKFLSPGLIGLLVVAIIQNSKIKNQKPKFMVIIMIVSFLLALGPVLKWKGNTVKINGWPVPLPYAVTYYLIPGMSAFRSPSRWIWVSGFSTVLIAAVGLRNSSNRTLVLLWGIIVLTATRTLPDVVHLPKKQDYPPVYSWLKDQPGKTMVELPIYLWSDTDGREEMRMIYRLEHGKNLVNGFSGYTPPDYYDLYKNQNNWEMLPSVDLYVVHKDLGYQGKIKGRLVWQDEKTAVYTRN
jgi:hypothetical protein